MMMIREFHQDVDPNIHHNSNNNSEGCQDYSQNVVVHILNRNFAKLFVELDDDDCEDELIDSNELLLLIVS
jgi:hypothetical protein